MPSSAPVTQLINRQERSVRITSPYGDDIQLMLRSELAEHFGGAHFAKSIQFFQNGTELSDGLAIDPDQQINIRYPLAGGAGCSTINTFPEVGRVHLLCNKCGLQHLPDFTRDEWCASTCCCLYSSCGMKDWKQIQLLCLKCILAPLGCHTVNRIPEVLSVKLLCYKCGITHLPDFTRDDWQTGHVCCLYNNCGPKDMLQPQILCLKCWL